MLSLLVPEHAQRKVIPRLKRLAQKAGVPVKQIEGQTILIKEVWTVNELPPNTVKRFAIVCDRFEIGDLPRTNGWQFVARLEHTGLGNLVTLAPGETGVGVSGIESWREAANVCEHCHMKRNRKDTFIIRGPNGELKQIGRRCLADFLLSNPTQLVAQAELVRSVGECQEDDEYWGGGFWATPTTDEFLACCVAAIERDGFRKTSEDMSTMNRAWFASGPCPTNRFENRELIEEWHELQPTDAHRERAAMVRAWGAALTDTSNDYLYNVKLVCALPALRKLSRYGGILASVPNAYSRAMAKLAEANTKREAQAQATDPIGTKGARETFDVTFIKRFGYDNEFGGGGIRCIFRDAAGREFVWFATGKCPQEADISKRMKLTGKVKKLGHYNGRPQTILGRCKWEEVVA